jgi:hypothetical protein
MADDTAEKLAAYGLAKCVYAAAHDIEPREVDDTDGGYDDVRHYVFVDWCQTLEPLALALGLADDADYPDILEAINELKQVAVGSSGDGETPGDAGA